MSTRLSTRNLFSPLKNPELTIRRRTRVDHNLLDDFNMAINGNGDNQPPLEGGDLPVPDLRTIEELCQSTLNGQGGPIALIAIQATNFGLKNDMIQQVQNSCQFHGLSGEDATWERYKLSIDRCSNHNLLTVTQIDTFYNGLTLRYRDTVNAAADGTFMKRCPEECYDLIENMTAHHNDWNTSAQMTTVGQTQNVYAAGAYNQGSHVQNPPPAYQSPSYQALVQQASIPQPQVVTTTEFTNYMKENDAILKNMQMNMTSLTNSNLKLKNMFGQFMKMNTASSSGSRTLPSNTITNPKEDLKVPNSKPVVSPVVEPVEALVSAPKPNPKPLIPYPSRLNDQKLREKANNQMEKFFQIFQDLNFNISFVDALIHMPKFASTIKRLLQIFIP
uniref:Reverse transcriptase domain-containing protein n=1 Tax=Tanacetum cinerariifolium TaxID=118510 RepID=A0A6L2KM46_TANCI|nr:reverse transcriptase domain-containing protein [Tanacetum cinerariifolium]